MPGLAMSKAVPRPRFISPLSRAAGGALAANAASRARTSLSALGGSAWNKVTCARTRLRSGGKCRRRKASAQAKTSGGSSAVIRSGARGAGGGVGGGPPPPPPRAGGGGSAPAQLGLARPRLLCALEDFEQLLGRGLA